MSTILVFGAIPPNRSGAPLAFHRLLLTRNLNEIRRRIITEDYTMIIIDLDGREKKGMELAAYIRSIPKQCMTPILFVSSSHKLEWDAFHNIHCYDFFIKPLTTQDILKIMYLFLQKTDGVKPGRTIMFSNGSKRFPINIDDILYLESINRDVIVHTTTSEVGVSSLHLSDFLKAYKEDFVQVRRSTVVNKSMIRCVNPTAALVELKNNRETLSIGKTYIPTIRKLFDGT